MLFHVQTVFLPSAVSGESTPLLFLPDRSAPWCAISSELFASRPFPLSVQTAFFLDLAAGRQTRVSSFSPPLPDAAFLPGLYF